MKQLLFAFLALFALPVWAVPAFNAASNNVAADSATVSVSHTAAGSDRCALISVYQGADHLITAISYGAQTPTLIDNQGRLSLYGLVAPNTGAQTVSVTTDTAAAGILIGVVSYTACAQTSTFGTPVGFSNSELTSITATGIVSATGALVVDVAAMIQIAMTAGAGQTERISADDPGVGFWSVGMSEKAGAATVDMTWTATSTAGDNDIIGVSIAASGGGGGSTVPVKFYHYVNGKKK